MRIGFGQIMKFLPIGKVEKLMTQEFKLKRLPKNLALQENVGIEYGNEFCQIYSLKNLYG